MKKSLLIVLTMGLCVMAQSQTVTTGILRENAAVVTTVFKSDSVNVTNKPVWLKVFADSTTTSVFVAFGNDTASGHYITVKPGKSLELDRIEKVGFIRTRSSTGTCARRIQWGYQK